METENTINQRLWIIAFGVGWVIYSAGILKKGAHIQNLIWQHNIYFGNLLDKKNTRVSLLFTFFLKIKIVFCHENTLFSHNAQKQKMRNNKRGKPGFIIRLAVLCNGMLFKSPAPLNTLLHGCDPKQKPPSLYPWCYSPNGLFSWQAGEQKTPLQLIFPTGSMMMSLDVVCSRAADKDGGRAGSVYSILGFGMQPLCCSMFDTYCSALESAQTSLDWALCSEPAASVQSNELFWPPCLWRTALSIGNMSV